jgi:hypothetical protein
VPTARGTVYSWQEGELMLLHQIAVHITVRAEDKDIAMKKLSDFLSIALTEEQLINEAQSIQDYSIEEVLESYPEAQQDLPFYE